VDAQPEEGGLEGGSEGGAGGEAGAGGMTGGTGGSGGTSGYGGMPGVGGTNLDAGVDPGADGSGDQAAEGGCSCVQAGRSHGSWGVWLLMGLGWLGVRRRR
jgi:MYXO-CTERM domain-containing protein